MLELKMAEQLIDGTYDEKAKSLRKLSQLQPTEETQALIIDAIKDEALTVCFAHFHITRVVLFVDSLEILLALKLNAICGAATAARVYSSSRQWCVQTVPDSHTLFWLIAERSSAGDPGHLAASPEQLES